MTTTPPGAISPRLGPPEQAHMATSLRKLSAQEILADATDQRDAQEMAELDTGAEMRGQGSRTITSSMVVRKKGIARWVEWMERMWVRHVSLKVPAEKRRDFLALERTYLAYVRTSLALSNTGVIIAQLFQLVQKQAAGAGGKVQDGLPLAACFIISSIIVVLLGAVRYWRQQTAMAREKVCAGGFEILWIMFIVIALTVAAFVVLIVFDIEGKV